MTNNYLYGVKRYRYPHLSEAYRIENGWSLWRAAKNQCSSPETKISFHPPVKTPEHPAAERILMALAGQMRRIPRISRAEPQYSG